jgi:hypothetical protein
MASFIKKAWVSLLLIFIAVVMVGLGIYFNSNAYWANKTDVSLFNKGMEAYNAGYTLLPATADRPEEQSVMRAVAYLQQAYTNSKDESLKALALYDIGTLMGIEGLGILGDKTPLFVISEAIGKLSEAVRLNPDNEAAKYNLELLEKVQAILQPPGGAAVSEKAVGTMGGLAGYASGVIYKGY